MARFKNAQWEPPSTATGQIASWEAVRLAVMMDIRDELQTLNAVFRCPNFQSIPRELRAIKRELATMRKARAK